MTGSPEDQARNEITTLEREHTLRRWIWEWERPKKAMLASCLYLVYKHMLLVKLYHVHLKLCQDTA